MDFVQLRFHRWGVSPQRLETLDRSRLELPIVDA